MKLKEELINKIVVSMISVLDRDQIRILRNQLYVHLSNIDIMEKQTLPVPYEESDFYLVQKFADAKLAAGKSNGTVEQYTRAAKNLIAFSGKKISDIDEDDIRSYLQQYHCTKMVGNTTLRNTRAYLSSFFSWLRKNRYIKENPMDLVEAIKPDNIVKTPFSDEEVVAIKDECRDIRDRAMVDFLNSSMVRVGELVKLNRQDIQFGNRECIVFGKGRKERIVYFDGAAKRHLEEYLKSRVDNNPALFVSLCGESPHRLTIKGVQSRLKVLGERANVLKVHPHRFRRTGATRCLASGVPLDALQDLMGHSDIKTTQIYAKNNRQTVKNYFTKVYV